MIAIGRTRGEIEKAKGELRKDAHRLRILSRKRFGIKAGEVLRDRLISNLPLPVDAAISAHWPIGSEIDIRPLLLAMLKRGHKILLPDMTDPNQPLTFRPWRGGAITERDRAGVPVPSAPCHTDPPDIVIVPMLAFDRDGVRLGRGGGHWDRTLAALRRSNWRLLVVGVGWSANEVLRAPSLPHDEPVDMVVTERELFFTGGRG
ncbi:MAG: 5-formyltetrahydrofolate cyclo-ligase [Pseudomonadota bacterium]|nr:5-formyltetrahydrofolate cyclo-ligase [Pseudomonadota bacterium]